MRRCGILYAPDYVINAGGPINAAQELEPGGYDRDAALARVARIGATRARVFALAEARRQPTNEATDRMARERLHRRRIARGALTRSWCQEITRHIERRHFVARLAASIS